MNSIMIDAMEKGWLPDLAIRYGIRKLCQERLVSLTQPTPELEQKAQKQYVDVLRKSPLAVHTQEANEQHYELPPEFFSIVLGKNKKYSSAFWPDHCESLDEAESVALQKTMERAEIQDGMQILELGCGWGSLTLAMAKAYPNSKIVALSNSRPQREWIEAQASQRGLTNVTILTRNIASVENLDQEFGSFDRVVSVEMFEHLRNYEMLFEKISGWLKPQGKLFVHVFSHKQYSYFFETEGEDNWMGRYFFTGGQMPAHNLLPEFQHHLQLEKHWIWNGTHYGKTSEAWLENMDANKEEIMKIFRPVYKDDAKVWFQRWRVFFMSCAELFNYAEGNEWGVSHYLFTNKEGI
jgi:cyclopropane-fatty-acyl-phospholipid synthase